MKKHFIYILIILIVMVNIAAKGQSQATDTGANTDLDLGDVSVDTKGPPPGNPFVQGKEGNWRVRRSWQLQRERTQTRANSNDNVNVRIDGTYINFIPFWNPASTPEGSWFRKDDTKWVFKTQVNFYNPFGTFELETVDPLNRFSSSLFGYNNTLPKAVGLNARYREIGFDGFEDYAFAKCANAHFSFQLVDGIENKLSDKNSHSGRYSIRVAPNEVVTMKNVFSICEPDPTPTVVR